MAQRVDEGQRVAPELLERSRHRAAREADPADIKQDDLALTRNVVDEGGIPVAEVSE